MNILRFTVAMATVASSSLLHASPMYDDVSYNEFECIVPEVLKKEEQHAGDEGLTPIINAFKETDINNDNRICQDEVAAMHKGNEGSWMRYDVNGDGCITPKEAMIVLRNDIEKIWERQYLDLDSNRDGKVTKKDLERIFKKKITGTLTASQIMDKYDIDKDGEITLDEYISQSIMTFKSAKNELLGYEGE